MGTTAQKLAYTATSVNDIQAAIIEKGVAVPSTVPLGEYGNKIREISTGIVPTGNIQLTKQSGTDVTNYATASVKSGAVSTPATTITSTPTITVSASGLITASNSKTQSVTPNVSTAGWISSGTAGTITVSGSGTSQLAVQAAKTVTPSESSQTAVASGKYTTGNVTVAAITATYVGTGVTRKAATTITPTSSSQTAVASNVYTTGNITVAAIPTETGSATDNGTYNPTSGKFYSSFTVNVPYKTYRTGSGAPSSSLGNDGDIYIDMS